MPKYVYARHPASKTHIDLKEINLPGHRFGYVKRWMRAEPANMAQYKALCTCGWKGTDWTYTKRIAYSMHFATHIEEAKKQGTFFDQDAMP